MKPPAETTLLAFPAPDITHPGLALSLLSHPSERGMERDAITLCNLPRWDLTRRTHDEAIVEIGKLADVLKRASEGLCNLYLRMTDMIRDHGLTDSEIRKVLNPHFPPPRVSEFIRVASAPKDVYMKYRAGIAGFRATLSQCRLYRVTPSKELTRKKIRRTAERLVALMGHGEVEVRGKKVTVSS